MESLLLPTTPLAGLGFALFAVDDEETISGGGMRSASEEATRACAGRTSIWTSGTLSAGTVLVVSGGCGGVGMVPSLAGVSLAERGVASPSERPMHN